MSSIKSIGEGNFAQVISTAADLIRGGGLVAFPTETVYGLGASALDEAAIERIYRVKGRESDKPLALLVADRDMVKELALWLPDYGLRLMDEYWPGPLTLVLEASTKVPPSVKSSKGTIGLRMPDHPVALELIRRSGVPLAATSANLSGEASPTTADEIEKTLGARIDLIIDGGATEVKVPSTVIDATGERPVVVREGGISSLSVLTTVQ